MRLQWFPDISVALCADNFAHLSRFCFGPTALLDDVGFSRHLVFPIINLYRLQNRRTTNTADIQQNGEGVDYSGTRVRVKLQENFYRRGPGEKVACKMIG